VQTPLVSIIIPCFNAQAWLDATLRSAIAQTWPATEIIVVDDGSTDGSLAIARSREGGRVTVVSQANRGAAAARNRGLAVARGSFIQFLDSDDLLSPDKISSQVEVLAGAPPGAVASCRWGRFRSEPAEAVFSDTAVFRDFVPARDFLIHVAETSDMMHPAAWLTPRAVAEASGPWDESLSLNDDGEYFCRVLLRASSIHFATSGSVYYRSGLSGSLSGQVSRRAMVSVHRSIALFAGHLLSADDSPRTRRALAIYWRRLQYELYPQAIDLSRDAGAQSRALGGASVPLPFGPRLRALAAVAGWRFARRMQGWLQRRA
jgi:glycosyltransferase involved in cell wall biosynthesis